LQDLFAGMPHIYYINMARSANRRTHMEEMLRRHGIPSTRIEALDAKDPTAQARVAAHSPADVGGDACADNLESCAKYYRPVQFCTASHILAMATYLNHSSEPFAIIAEDDMLVDAYSEFWAKPMAEYIAALPEDWQIGQLSVNIQGAHVAGMDLKSWVKKAPSWFGTAAYVIRRDTAQLLVDKFMRADGVIDLLSLEPKHVYTEPMLYAKPRVVYTLPLLGYLTEDSTLHDSETGKRVQTVRRLRGLWKREQQRHLATRSVTRDEL
jgi:GR25 family glycosyltransferase involved in LPS biosynthesis